MTEKAILHSRILVVDDDPSTLALLDALLTSWGFTDVQTTTESDHVVAMCTRAAPDLLVLDLTMGAPDGFEVMSRLSPWTSSPTPLPILVLTGEGSPAIRSRALAAGARDYVTKPFDQEEVRLRVINLLDMRRLQQDANRRAQHLEEHVRERTRDLALSRVELLERLGMAAEFRDDETREHTQRVGRTSRMLAELLGVGSEETELLALAAPLHDIGKLGIPDDILLKRGPLTDEQRVVMKGHVQMGAALLAGSSSPVLQVAETVVLTHHERWDGAGYPAAMAGAEIPLEGRIVAVADVFDALTHVRPYKDAWPVADALELVVGESGHHFDPAVVDAFASLDHMGLLGSVERPPAPLAPVLAEGGWDHTRSGVGRTAGGYQRRPTSESRRMHRTVAHGAAPVVRGVGPPVGPATALAELLTHDAADVFEQVARVVYVERRRGWFGLPESADLRMNWAKALASASLTGDDEGALAATRTLMRQAELAGTSFVERYSFLTRCSNLVARRLSRDEAAGRAELVIARRLFAALAFSLLEDVSAGS